MTIVNLLILLPQAKRCRPKKPMRHYVYNFMLFYHRFLSLWRKENNQVEDTYSTVKDDPSRLQESESNMEFTMVHSPEVRDECIYAVVSKGSKRNSSNLSSEKVDYSKIGLNDSIRKKPTSNNSQHFGNDSQYLMQDVYSSLDDISLHQTIEQEWVFLLFIISCIFEFII